MELKHVDARSAQQKPAMPVASGVEPRCLDGGVRDFTNKCKSLL